jgi:Kef-type K+ transport system membrane component KefB
VAVNTAFVLAALTVAPSVLRRLSAARWNRLASQQPIAWALAVLFGYVALAAALEVTIVFAAFLAGFGLVGGMHRTESERFKAPLDNITSVSIGLFIPVYFALVGYSLDFSRDFNPAVFGGFLIGSSIVHMSAVALATRCAGFRGLDVVNIAIAHNARGGPGIVMASVAFSEGIINLSMFTALVLTSVVTSQAAGFWLDRVLRNGWPLLSGSDLRKRGIEPETDAPADAPAPLPATVNGHAAKQPVG